MRGLASPALAPPAPCLHKVCAGLPPCQTRVIPTGEPLAPPELRAVGLRVQQPIPLLLGLLCIRLLGALHTTNDLWKRKGDEDQQPVEQEGSC